MAGEAPAEDLEVAFDPAAQLTERLGTLLLGFAGPLFQPAGLRPVAAARRETGGVYDEPGEDRVGVVPPANIDSRSNSRKDWRDRA